MERVETLSLWTSPKCLWIEAPLPNKDLPVIAIHRDANVKVELTDPSSISTVAVRKTIYGLLGILELPLSTCLVIIAQRKKVGDIDGKPVHRLETVEFIPIWGKSDTSSAEVEAHRYSLNLLQETFGTPYFYFSYTGDLTNTAGRHLLSQLVILKRKMTFHLFSPCRETSKYCSGSQWTTTLSVEQSRHKIPMELPSSKYNVAICSRMQSNYHIPLFYSFDSRGCVYSPM